MRICELRCKQVINKSDCKIIGCVADIEFDTCTGCITALIVPGPAKMFCIFGREIEYVIPYKCVCCIGSDVILVEADLEKIINKCT
jgi:YlmC/YmxH family sporulation protein